MAIKDDFALLGLAPGAEPDKIIIAYRYRAAQVHPDKPDGDAGAFSKLNGAYHRALQYAHDEPCPTCRGTRKEKKTRGFATVELPCSACVGSGKRHANKKI